MSTGQELANGAKGASYIQSYRSEFQFDLGLGTLTDAQLCSKYSLTEQQLVDAKAFYEAGNDLELDRLLSSANPVKNPVSEPAGPKQEDLPAEPPAPKQEYGYEAKPLGRYVFVKPVPKDHQGRLIVPAAFESNSDMGFVHAVGPEVTLITPGMLVMFDKYAGEQERFQLLDEEGDLITLVKLYTENVTAVLTRKKTRAFRE